MEAIIDTTMDIYFNEYQRTYRSLQEAAQYTASCFIYQRERIKSTYSFAFNSSFSKVGSLASKKAKYER